MPPAVGCARCAAFDVQANLLREVVTSEDIENGCAGPQKILAQFPVADVRGTTREHPLACLDGRLLVTEADARPAAAGRLGLAPAVKLAKRPAPSAPLRATPPAEAAPEGRPAPKPPAPKRPSAPKKPPAPKKPRAAAPKTKVQWATVKTL